MNWNQPLPRGRGGWEVAAPTVCRRSACRPRFEVPMCGQSARVAGQATKIVCEGDKRVGRRFKPVFPPETKTGLAAPDSLFKIYQ